MKDAEAAYPRALEVKSQLLDLRMKAGMVLDAGEVRGLLELIELGDPDTERDRIFRAVRRLVKLKSSLSARKDGLSWGGDDEGPSPEVLSRSIQHAMARVTVTTEVGDSLAAFPLDSRFREAALDLAAKALRVRAVDPNVAALMLEAFERLVSISTGSVREGEGARGSVGLDAAPRRNKVTVSGMGWSGASAVYDFFCDQDDVIPVGGGFRPFTGNWSIAPIFEHCSQADECARALILFLLQKYFGVWPADNAPMHRMYEQFLREESGEKLWEAFLYSCRQFERLIAEAYREGQGVDEIGLRNTFGGALDFYAQSYGEGQLYLFDQLLKFGSQGFEGLGYMEGFDMVCVVRDPRDVYATLKMNASAPPVERFASRYASQRRMLDKAIGAQVPGNERITVVGFEAFVLNEGLRQRLAEKLGLSGGIRMEGSQFKPEESSENIGVYRQILNEDERRFIEGQLSPFLEGPAI
ncbi:hypothetical protein J2T60_001892 [Natronospira proteinivora]|uniref:Sulfotransferase family protein n=1 Tax=Natronospira proteinivora TaxID=1807133 RepID=A0ABT1G9A7_9GAMM|nr:hypothetical protein [Natronospira proteinivora]MCP1727892.1 hypothetical protein [Natronospira proteinivora]